MGRFQQLIEQATRLPPLTTAIIDPAEQHVMEAVRAALEQEIIVPVFVGVRERIEATAASVGVSLAEHRIIEAVDDEHAAEQATQLAGSGEVNCLMKGALHTDVLMRPVLKNLRTARRISHVFIAELASYHKLLFITDAAINIAPDLAQKAAIVQNAVDLARILGITMPKVAALSAVETVNSGIASTLDAACLSKMAQRGQIHHAIVDGPLALDLALSSEAAQTKEMDSEVAGDADILLVPELVSGNMLAKCLEHLAGAVLAGGILGAQVPIILPSRSDPPAGRLASVAIASILHHDQSRIPGDV